MKRVSIKRTSINKRSSRKNRSQRGGGLFSKRKETTAIYDHDVAKALVVAKALRKLMCVMIMASVIYNKFVYNQESPDTEFMKKYKSLIGELEPLTKYSDQFNNDNRYKLLYHEHDTIFKLIISGPKLLLRNPYWQSIHSGPYENEIEKGKKAMFQQFMEDMNIHEGRTKMLQQIINPHDSTNLSSILEGETINDAVKNFDIPTFININPIILSDEEYIKRQSERDAKRPNSSV